MALQRSDCALARYIKAITSNASGMPGSVLYGKHAVTVLARGAPKGGKEQADRDAKDTASAASFVCGMWLRYQLHGGRQAKGDTESCANVS